MFNRKEKLEKKHKELAKKRQSQRVEYLISDDVSFEISEAFRNLKASLTVSIPKKQSGEGTTILMTSAFPEDGKSTISVNIAMMFAFSDAKVIVVDADERKGRVARFFKKKHSPGLADYLSGQAELKDVIHQAEQNENLFFIPCGTHSPRPYELLESEEMKNLLTKLKQDYDYIIIDTPPLLLVSDALALSSQADGAVLVCRQFESYLNDVSKALEKLKFAKTNVLGVVVNDYDTREKLNERADKYKYYSYSI